MEEIDIDVNPANGSCTIEIPCSSGRYFAVKSLGGELELFYEGDGSENSGPNYKNRCEKQDDGTWFGFLPGEAGFTGIFRPGTPEHNALEALAAEDLDINTAMAAMAFRDSDAETRE